MLDRELFRSEETYAKIRADPRWNAMTIKLAFQFMSLADGFAPPAVATDTAANRDES